MSAIVLEFLEAFEASTKVFIRLLTIMQANSYLQEALGGGEKIEV
jgi:hypothetical protein